MNMIQSNAKPKKNDILRNKMVIYHEDFIAFLTFDLNKHYICLNACVMYVY